MLFFFNFNEVYLIYNVMLISVVQQSDSLIHIYILFLFLILFYYLAASGLSCGTRDLHCSLWDLALHRMGPFIAACGIFHCGVQASP